MLDLPDGTVLFTVGGGQPYVYRPDGTALNTGQPTIINITTNYYRSYHLTGTLLNGISEGAGYGDDAQMNSNYPLVRMTNNGTGEVYYARTYDWSSTGVMTGTNIVSTEFMVPANLPAGDYSLVVVANGNSSAPVPFTFNPDPLSITLPTGFAGSGPIGGPFNPSDQAYFLTNSGTSTLNWTLVNTSVWLNVSSEAGSLVAGGQSALIVSVSPAATNLQVGTYPATVWFTNLTSGAVQSIPFRLEINPLLQNGGFEYGSFADWMVSGNQGNSHVVGNYNGIGGSLNSAHSGNYSALLGANDTVGYLSQTLSTIPGQSYLLSLFVNNSAVANSSNEFAISWDGLVLFDQKGFAMSGWSNLQFVVWSTSDSTDLEFSFINPTNYFIIDDVSLTNLPSTLTIASQPSGQVIPDGGNAIFSVLASGPPPFTYQWSKNGSNLLDGGDIAGSTTATLSVSNAVVFDGGNYAVIVSEGSQSLTSQTATLTVIGPGNSPDCAVSAPKGLVSWWSGNYTANDLVGTNNGTLESGATYASGEVGYAFHLNGINQYVNVPASSTLAITGQVTVLAWIKRSAMGVQHSIVEKYAPTAGGYALRVASNDKLQFYCLDNSNAGGSVTGATTIVSNLFYHVAGLWNGSNLVVFVNGQLDGTYNYTQNPKPGAVPLRIGARGDDTMTPFAGIIDEAQVYNRALSASEIQAIYQAGTNGMCAPTPLMFAGSPGYTKSNGVVLNVSLRSGQTYRIQANTNLVSTNWVVLTNFTAGTAPVSYFTNLNATNIPQQFFRIVSP